MDRSSWPYVSGLLLQFYEDIKHININDISVAKGWHWFTHAEPLLGAIAICFFFMIWCYLVSLISGNYSQVDKLWPIMPMVYAWYFVLEPVFSGRSDGLDPRMTLMACCITLWGLRLTYNYARKGGYRWKHEDYRWVIVRKNMGFVLFQILNATFIAIIQNIIILWCVTPIYLAWLNHGTPLNTMDYVAASLFLTFWLIEVVADQQQWNFHQMKKNNNNKVAPGFIHTGLFRYSRHPNFFGEMSLWWSFYLFSYAVTQPNISSYQSLFNWTGIGALCLTGLFQGSTTLTELISNSKYPEYKSYQASTSRIIPWYSGSFNPSRSRKKQA
jgi:steroid 5-alpha reductase family enzyme